MGVMNSRLRIGLAVLKELSKNEKWRLMTGLS